MRPLTIAALTLLAGTGARVAAQAAPVSPELRAIEIRTRERRLDGRQSPRFTPFVGGESWIYIDSIRQLGSAQALFARASDQSPRPAQGVVTRAPNGHVVGVSITSGDRRPDLWRGPGDDSAHAARRRIVDEVRQRPALPAPRLWDLTLDFHPPRLARGARWMDTIDLAADSLGSGQALVGHRVSTIVGDTIVGGRRLWIVRDSASVQYVEQVLIDETSLDTLVTMSRKTSGIVRGQMLYDAQLGLFRARDDTTTLDGIAELRYPDGRSFRKRARDEVMRRLTTYDAREYTARRDSVQRERMRNSGGVVFVPANDVDQRLTKGDTVVRDSLVRDWRAADDPNDWLFLYGRLRMWTHDPAFVKRLEQMRIAQGDSAFLLQSLAQRPYSHAYGSGPIDTTTMRTLIRVMGDPALPYAFGVQPSELYDEMAQALTTYPPAAIPDSSSWPCTLAACRLLAEQWRVAAEPRLKQIGLLAHFVLEPRVWADTLFAVARQSGALLQGALFLGSGVGAIWASASHAPLPSPDDDIHAWMEWMNGENPAFRRWRERSMPPAAATRLAPTSLRFDQSHAVAIRFTMARTGRDVVGELRRKLAAATSDSATLVYGYMLLRLGEHHPNVDDVAAHLRSTSGALRTLGNAEIHTLFTGRVPRADSATTVLLQDQLIATALGRGKAWRPLSPGPNDARPPREVANEMTLLLADSLAPAVREKWAPFVPVVTAKEWAARDIRAGGTLFTVTGPERVGPFARIRVESSGRVARAADQAPWLYYASTTYYLMELGDEWVIVGVESWVT